MPQSFTAFSKCLLWAGLVSLPPRITDLIGRQGTGEVKLYQQTLITAQKNNKRGVIRSHIFGREVVKGSRLMHFKELTLVKARIRRCRNRDESPVMAILQ